MLTKQIFTLLIICVLLFGQTLAQQNTNIITKKNKISPELDQKVVGLLRETIKEIPNLKTEENRQYFIIETARLLWDYDEKESQAMFEGVMKNIRQSISQIVSEASPNYSKSIIEENYHQLGIKYFFRFENIKSLRKHLIGNLAVVNPEIAFDFLKETSQMLPQVDGDLRFKDTFYNLEEIIIRSFILRNETDKAVKVLHGMLKEEFSDDLVKQIGIIYEKDPEIGSVFAEEVLQYIKSAKLNNNQNYIIKQFLEKAIESKKINQNKPLLNDNSITNLAKFLGQSVLAIKKVSYTLDKPNEYADLIEKYAPQEAKQIRQKFNKNLPANKESVEYEKELDESVKKQMAGSMENFNKELAGTKKREVEKKEICQKLENNKFSAEEKTQIIEQIKKLISEMSEIKRRNQKVKEMVAFAMISKDKEIVEKLMNEAATLTNQKTKSYEDYMSNWWLASGYSSFNPERSFTILEDTIPKFNEVISGFSKVAEFMDDSSSIFANGEITLISGIGDGVGANFLKELTDNQLVIQNLAKSDFTRTKKLVDKFDRLEFRLTARIIVIEALLGGTNEIEN